MSLQVYKGNRDGFIWRCAKRHCKKRISIRSGSYFERSKLPIEKMWMTIVCLLKFPKMLATYMSEILEISEQALVDWGNYVRETISHYYLENPLVLGGDKAVQIDESLFGGRRKYNRGNHQRHIKSWVFGIVEECTNRCVLWPVKNRKRKTLTNVVTDHVQVQSVIKSDEWPAYKRLGKRGFKHLTVNHSVSFVSQDGIHTQLIESVWSQVKSSLKLKRGTSKKHLAGYLDLYSFLCDAKFQNRSPIDLFIQLVQADHCY
jgi:IS1 family transposase